MSEETHMCDACGAVAGVLERVVGIIRDERDNWQRVACWNPPGPTLRELALAKAEVLQDLLVRLGPEVARKGAPT